MQKLTTFNVSSFQGSFSLKIQKLRVAFLNPVQVHVFALSQFLYRLEFDWVAKPWLRICCLGSLRRLGWCDRIVRNLPSTADRLDPLLHESWRWRVTVISWGRIEDAEDRSEKEEAVMVVLGVGAEKPFPAKSCSSSMFVQDTGQEVYPGLSRVRDRMRIAASCISYASQSRAF